MPAPGRLELVRRFVNTLDIEDGTDELGTTHQCAHWLQANGLLAPKHALTPSEAEHVRSIREALRDVLVSNHHESETHRPALDTLNGVIREAQLLVTLDDRGWAIHPQVERVSPVAGAMGKLMVTVLDGMSDGTWDRLKVCSNDVCRWAFYDRSRARSGKWCSMSICGNRAKQQAWRSRQAETSSS